MKFEDVKRGHIISYEYEIIGRCIDLIVKRTKNKLYTESGIIDRNYWKYVSDVKIIKGKSWDQAHEEHCQKLQLDRVLSKFESTNVVDIVKLRVSQSTDDVYIIYIKSEDRFCTRGLNLSLKTVESVIEDLEKIKDE